MKKIIFISLWVLFVQVLFIRVVLSAADSGGELVKPDWFKQSFLDLEEDLEDANNNDKLIMLYFYQNGCPYCNKLLKDNFSQSDIVNRMKRGYDVLELNMWGDRSITSFSGDEYSEKEFARKMKVMFTPTLIVLDKKGETLFRINGYYSPDKFSAVLDYLSLKSHSLLSFTEFFRQQTQIKKSAQSSALHKEKFFSQTDNLQNLIKKTNKPLIVLFEQGNCQDCDELHGDFFRRLPLYQKLKQFTIVQIDINSDKTIITPDGRRMSRKDFAQQENIQYTPSLFFYESGDKIDNKPIFRSEAYLKGFHLETVLDYISSTAYKTEPEFQRFVQRRAEEMAEKGIEVDLWK
ncbi:MAG: thioredoxin fold domain-containing protein [gamma proteobacterium symbiont of Taylorina sp.]|nr:thioredoxin fold domain-containing protein [gamma proteobacterium symbiont of Taylorina sp.]